MACVRYRRGRWIIDFYDQDGERRWYTMPKGSSKKDANIKKGELEKKVQKKTYITPKTLPLFSTVADDWLKSKVNIRENTKEGYRGHMETHLKPAFEGMKINQITLAVIEQFRATLLKTGTTVATTKKILSTLSQIMKYAVKHHYQDYNPVRDLERLQTPHNEDEEDLNILQPDQISSLVNATATPGDKVLLMVAALTGMRQGELFGLKWTDVDWINKQIHVKRTYNHGRFYGPKSKTSKRRIDIAPELVIELKKWRLVCPRGELDLVFPNSKGKPANKSNFLIRRFYPALASAGLPHMRFHDLRHTYAALLLDQGENIKYIQRQLGHSSIKVTLDIYGHLMSDVNQEAAAKLGSKIFGFNNGSSLPVAE
jgi:integrase